MERVASVGVGIALVAINVEIYQHMTPSIQDQRVALPGDRDSTQAEKTARWTAAAITLLVSAVTWDPTVFVLGGASIIALSWTQRHANHGVHPAGPAFTPRSRSTSAAAAAGADVTVGPVMAGAEIGVGAY